MAILTCEDLSTTGAGDILLEAINENTTRSTKGVGQKSIVLLGDSITNQNQFSSATESQTQSIGFFSVANYMTGNYFNVVNYAGVSGQNTDEILDRIPTDVEPYNPDYVMFLGGTNDLLQGVSVNSIKDNIVAILDSLLSLGVQAVIGTVPPSSLLPSESDWGTVNDFIRSTANERGILCADFDSAMTVATETSYPYSSSSFFYDDLHPNAIGARLMATELYKTLSSVVNKVNLFAANPSSPSNIAANPQNSGTGGSMNNGGTGVAPDNVTTFLSPLGSGSSVTGSVITEGNKRIHQIDITGTENTTSFTRRDIAGVITEGKSYYAIAEVELTATDCPTVMLQVRERSGSTTVFTAYSLRSTAGNASIPSIDEKGVLITPVFVAKAGSDGAILDLFITATTATIKIGRMQLIQVD